MAICRVCSKASTYNAVQASSRSPEPAAPRSRCSGNAFEQSVGRQLRRRGLAKRALGRSTYSRSRRLGARVCSALGQGTRRLCVCVCVCVCGRAPAAARRRRNWAAQGQAAAAAACRHPTLERKGLLSAVSALPHAAAAAASAAAASAAAASAAAASEPHLQQTFLMRPLQRTRIVTGQL